MFKIVLFNNKVLIKNLPFNNKILIKKLFFHNKTLIEIVLKILTFKLTYYAKEKKTK